MTDKGFIREVSNEITRQQLGKSKFTKRKFKIFILTIIIIFVISTISNFLLEKPLDLIWNNIVSMSSDSTNIIRSFNLTITFNPTDIIQVDGRVNLQLEKNDKGVWKIVNWIDESNF